MSLYTSFVYMPAWTASNDSTLVEISDARADNFGEQLLTAFKQHARITYTMDDNILPTYIDAAIMHIEQVLEFPIMPRSFDWSVGENTGYDKYEVPLRNSKAIGEQYDFEPLRGKVIIAAPTSWPVTLVVGFDASLNIPSDLKIAIFDMATMIEQNRSLIDYAGLALPSFLTSRYGIQRC